MEILKTKSLWPRSVSSWLVASLCLCASPLACSEQLKGSTPNRNPDAGLSAGAAQPNGDPVSSTGAGGSATNPRMGSGSSGSVPLPDAIGQGVVRRLTRTEYNFTVRDLFGSSLTPADAFPGDVGADGFDKASSPQSVVAAHLSAFEKGAATVIEAVFADPTQRAKVVSCDLVADANCMRQSLEAFLPRAWRRPIQPAEVARLMALGATEAQAGGPPEEQLKLALRGALTSPHFMYLIELDPDLTSTAPHPLNSYELAARLSYFLWSSTPDDELRAVATAGTLQDDAQLSQQLQRMLVDAKSSAMSSVFTAQWLQLAKLATHDIKPDIFPDVSPDIKTAMSAETQLFFQDLLQNGGALGTLLGADYAFINPALAAHYGLPVPATTDFIKVSVAGTTRVGGLLGHSSILTLTSSLEKTSAVKRGAWVLDNMLCSQPPPPPPDVMKQIIAQQQQTEMLTATSTQRDFLAVHRANPTCAGCHSVIDPVGLALENYNAVGQYRSMDKGVVVDASGMLRDGTAFRDAHEFAKILSSKPELGSCVAKKLFTFALGRAPSVDDSAHLASVVTTNQDQLANVLSKLVISKPFRFRRGG